MKTRRTSMKIIPTDVMVAEVHKSARLEERRMIEEGMAKRQHSAEVHEIAIYKMRHKDV